MLRRTRRSPRTWVRKTSKKPSTTVMAEKYAPGLVMTVSFRLSEFCVPNSPGAPPRPAPNNRLVPARADKEKLTLQSQSKSVAGFVVRPRPSTWQH